VDANGHPQVRAVSSTRGFTTFSLALLATLGACHERRAVTLAPATSSATAATAPKRTPPPRAPPNREERRTLAKTARDFQVSKLPSTSFDVDVLFRGQRDPKLVAAVHKALPAGARFRAPEGARDGKRFLVSARDGASTKVLVFDVSGKLLGSHQGEEPFFLADGSIAYRSGQSLFAWDGGSGAPVALGGPFKSLCVDKTCGPRMFVAAVDPGRKHALVALSGGGFVSDDNLDVLDLATGALAPVIGRSDDLAYLGGKLFGDGAFCTYEMPVSKSPDAPAPDATLLCFDPPWTTARALMVHSGGAPMIGEVGGLVVSGDTSVLHVLDRKSGRHRSYELPERGLFVALADGRSVAIEGDNHVLLVDVIDETYASLDIAQTVVLPLGPGVKAFVATGDGSASLVRY
jgi:hypothetical protein